MGIEVGSRARSRGIFGGGAEMAGKPSRSTGPVM